MKVSVNWLREYLSFELPSTDELVERIGAQLGAVEETIDSGARYRGAIVVRVVDCQKMENSDHLNVCRIDDGGVTPDVERGDDGLVQVVCGAPNVSAGVRVVWLPPGATVPSTYDGDPFVLEARSLRGVVSNGMLASAKELAIGDSHEGLLLLDASDGKPGDNFAETYGLNDHSIDIENKMFTHRPDCFGQLGVAREVAGIFDQSFKSPDWYIEHPSFQAGDGLPLTIHNELPNLVPRFTVVTLKNVTVGPSPVWLQSYLSRVGLRPINNVVDATNYMMLLTGQPLHAYDYDKVAALSDDGASLTVRHPHTNEQIGLLNGKTITPRPQAMLITTGQAAIGLGGVMGGANSETDATTKNLILESASFDMYEVRRTSMAHGLFSDAVTRFNKGQSPLQTRAVLGQAVTLLRELTGADVASAIIDDYQAPRPQPAVAVTTDFITARLGVALGATTMERLLQNVEFSVQVDAETLTITPPFWRTDIVMPEDIVEEIGRLYGFDKLPLVLPRRTIMPAVQDPLLSLKNRVRTSLSTAGANELLTYSFVHGNLLDKVGQPRDHAFKLANALSPDLQYYRFNGLPSLLDKLHANSKAGYDEFALFELSKGHNTRRSNDGTGVPVETDFLDLVYTNKIAQSGAAFYHARRLLDATASDLGVQLTYQPADETIPEFVATPYDAQRSALVRAGDLTLGMVGELKASVIQNLKLPPYTAAFTVTMAELLTASQQTASPYRPLSRFPSIEQDICFKVAAAISYAQLHQIVTETLSAHAPADSRCDVTLLDIYQRDSDNEHKQITFRITLVSYRKTMTDSEMSHVLETLVTAASDKLAAERV